LPKRCSNLRCINAILIGDFHVADHVFFAILFTCFARRKKSAR
jgi:hypothetical protein